MVSWHFLPKWVFLFPRKTRKTDLGWGLKRATESETRTTRFGGLGISRDCFWHLTLSFPPEFRPHPKCADFNFYCNICLYLLQFIIKIIFEIDLPEWAALKTCRKVFYVGIWYILWNFISICLKFLKFLKILSNFVPKFCKYLLHTV